MGAIISSPIKNFIGVIGLSIVGAVSHNLIQMIIATLILSFSIGMLNYILPIIIIGAIGFGTITGYIAYKILS